MIRWLKKHLSHHNPLRLAWHKAKATMAACRYGFPARQLTVIGITGTDGKTTTVGMVAHILHKNGIKVGALSTAFFQINDVITWNATQKTSPSPFLAQGFLRRLVREGCTHAVIECSSHGLIQHRMDFLYPSVAAITNIGEEHLDYHGTMEKYIAAKELLFLMLRKDGTKVINASDQTHERYKQIPTLWTIHYETDQSFGPPASDHECAFWSTDIREDDGTGITATIHCNTSTETWPLHLKVPGTFNVSNALCAIGCAHACSITESECVEALSSFKGIPGRMEILRDSPFRVYVDFTVTPQAYEKTLSALKQTLKPAQRLLVLTGSCGDRMKEKRPTVGKIVSSYADLMVVANEDPYTEDPEKIIDEVWAGIDQQKTEAHRIFDRREAIRFLFENARPGDVVILCGKGSDTTMMTAKGQIPWNEREIAIELLTSNK